jgi:ribokinase
VRILNFGSLNIDHVYQVDHIVRPGETIAGHGYSFFAGGKGANQSVAIARAGGRVVHIGKVGPEGQWMVDAMREDGVDVSRVQIADEPGGHAVILVEKGGQNSIVIHGGTNRKIETSHADAALAAAEPGDYVLLQNEINNGPHIMKQASTKGLNVAFNPAPMDNDVLGYPLDCVSLFIVNETEAEALCGSSERDRILGAMLEKYPDASVILTLGSKGAVYADAQGSRAVGGRNVKAVDTTAAGDTFIGYYMAAVQAGKPVEDALELANSAAALSVTRFGAQASIPRMNEVERV